MATQHPFPPRAPLGGRTPKSSNTYRVQPPPETAEPKVSLRELPLGNNIGLIAGLGVALVAIISVLLYYGL